jgi:hypothetical protein
MTVADVIAQLQKLPPDLLCVVGYDGMYEDAKIITEVDGTVLVVARTALYSQHAPYRLAGESESGAQRAVCLGDGGAIP